MVSTPSCRLAAKLAHPYIMLPLRGAACTVHEATRTLGNCPIDPTITPVVCNLFVVLYSGSFSLLSTDQQTRKKHHVVSPEAYYPSKRKIWIYISTENADGYKSGAIVVTNEISTSIYLLYNHSDQTQSIFLTKIGIALFMRCKTGIRTRCECGIPHFVRSHSGIHTGRECVRNGRLDRSVNR